MKNAGRKVSRCLSNLLQKRGTKAYGTAWRAIRRRGPAFHSDANVRFLIQGLRHADSHVVRDAARALTEIGAGASQPVLDAVVRLLCDGDSRRRMAAASALQALPDSAGGSQIVAETLLSRLGDPDPGCRRDAVRALGALAVAGRPISEALPDRLAPLLADSDAEVAYASVNAVVAMGPPVLARPCIRKALVRLLRYPNPHIVTAAAAALDDWKIVAKAVTAHLESTEPGVREDAVRCLGWFGERAVVSKPLLRRLAALLQDPSKDVVWAAADALRRMGPQATDHHIVRNALRALLEHPQYWRAAASAVTEWDAVAGAVLRRLQDPDPGVRLEAMRVLLSFSERATTPEPFLEYLSPVLRDADSRVASAARLAVRRMQVKRSARRRPAANRSRSQTQPAAGSGA